MAKVNFPAEGVADETALTPANSGGFYDSSSAPNASGNVTVFDTAQFMHGTSSIRVDRTTGTTAGYMMRSLEGGTREVIRIYVRFASVAPTGNIGILRLLNTSVANIASLFLTTAGKLQLQNAAGGELYLSPTALSANTWYRIELAVGPGTTSTTGAWSFQYHLGDTPSAIDSGSGAAANLGTVAAVGYLRVGRIDSGGGTGTVYWYDDVATSDQASGLIGPEGAVAPTGGGTLVDNRASIDMRTLSSAGGGGALSWAASKVSGETLTFVEPVDGFFVFTKSNVGPAVYRITTSEAGGGSDTDDFTIPAIGASAAVGYRVRRWIGTPGIPSASWD